MEFIFIAVNYNGYAHTKKYIESILEITKEKNDTVNIIIVDNQSETKDVEKHRNFIASKDNVILSLTGSNLGYFGGLNYGLDLIENKKSKVIIVGNNDLTFDIDFIINYKKIKYDNDIFLLAPNIITKEGRQQNPHVQDKVGKFEVFKSDIYFSNYYIGMFSKMLFSLIKTKRKKHFEIRTNEAQTVIKRGIGACYILTENFFKKFNQLDSKVFLWGEEAVLTHQIEQYNGKTLYTPTLRIIHHESASVCMIQSRKKYDILKESYKVYRSYL